MPTTTDGGEGAGPGRMTAEFEFDADKDRTNIEKHGVSLSLAAELEPLAYVEDERFDEPRFRLYGSVRGMAYCVAGTLREGKVRVISMRRAHAKEMKRYVAQAND